MYIDFQIKRSMMVKKIIFTLSMICFAMSTLLSLVGIISVIQLYFKVSIYYASLYASIFAGALGISSLVTPAVFSRFEKKKLIIVILIITGLCNLIQVFITDYHIAIIFRIIPAILYPIAVSTSLTIISKISPNDTNKVVLGISAGSILGLSITSYLGLTMGYQAAMLWYCQLDIVALVLTVLFLPNFEGNKEPIALQISHAKSKLFLYTIIFVFFLEVGVSVTYNYIPTYLRQVTMMDPEMIFVTLLLMGLLSMVGTTLIGYLLARNGKKTIFIYPIAFAIVMFVVGSFVKNPILEFCILMIFSLFDGSVYTFAQYCVTSSVRESPEFANGIFLLLCNISIFIGTMLGGFIIDKMNIMYIFYGSIILIIISAIFVSIRIRKYPNVQ